MAAAPSKQKRRAAEALKGVRLKRDLFKLSEEARQQIRRRDKAEKQAPEMSIRIK